MPMKIPWPGLFLALACVLGIAATGCVFELAYGDPDLECDTYSLDPRAEAPATIVVTSGRDSAQQTGLISAAELGASTLPSTQLILFRMARFRSPWLVLCRGNDGVRPSASALRVAVHGCPR